MSTCPNGHPSGADDYCDVCGARIGAPVTTPPSTPPPASTAAANAPPGGGADVTCPHCGITQDTGHRFCEVCGADLTTGAAPVAAPPTAPPNAPPNASTSPTGGRWEAVVAPDRAYYDRLDVDGVDFPVGAPARTFALADATVLIGRRSDRRGITPQIDLSGAPEDPGISHGHCSLVRQPDGSYAVVDNGSTNGTFVNEATTALTANRPVPLADGDRVHLGAWTTLTVHRR